jgi:flap endonuclease-1
VVKGWLGVQNLGDLILKKKVSMEELSGRTLTIDALNYLYAFLSVVRQPDGTPLMDEKTRITSHLSGLFYRTINLIESNIKPIFVFDGEPPTLKKDTIKERREIREAAKVKWEEALTAGDVVAARKYAQVALKLTDEMIQESKDLLDYLGVPWIRAPSEGEAQAAYMTKKGDAWSTGSQDYDSILFGSPRLVRNIVISGRRKLPSKNIYVKIEPELVDSAESLKTIGVTREQLIEIALILGTDFNPGIKGIGPKTALKLVKNYGSAERALKEKNLPVDAPYDEVRGIFLNPKVVDNYELKYGRIDKDKVVRLLVDEHDFSLERVQVALKRIEEVARTPKPTGLDQWL